MGAARRHAVAMVLAGLVCSAGWCQMGGRGARSAWLVLEGRLRTETSPAAAVALIREYEAAYGLEEHPAEVGPARALWAGRLARDERFVGGEFRTPAALRAGLAEAWPLLAAGMEVGVDANANAAGLREGLASVDRALALAGYDARAHAVRGFLLMRLGHWVGAETAFREALRLEPGLWWAKGNLAVVLASRKREVDASEAAVEAAGMVDGQNVYRDVLLVNAEVALGAVSGPARGRRSVQQAEARLAGLIAAREAEQAQHGLYRWGPVWLDRERYLDISQRVRESSERLSQQTALRDGALEDVRRYEREISRVQRELKTISDGLAAGGRGQSTLLERRRHLREDLEHFERNRSGAVQRVREANAAIAAEESQMPRPPYPGSPGALPVGALEGCVDGLAEFRGD